MKTVWVVLGKTESNDEHIAVFATKPEESVLDQLAHKWDGEPTREGPGDYGSYTFLEVTEHRVQ